MKKKIRSIKSSGNVFADLGVPDADAHFVKSEIVLGIAERIKARGLTQAQAARIIGLAQPDVSKLLRGQFTGYSFERLFGYLRALGNNIQIQIKPTRSNRTGAMRLDMG
jgi:predicted XRE-type DNA-binding protein